MPVTLIPARGYTLPSGASLASLTGCAPGGIVAIAVDTNGNPVWARVTRTWYQPSTGAATVECDSGLPPPPPPP